MNTVLSSSPVTLTTLRGESILLSLDQTRPVSSIHWKVWLCLFLSLICWLFPALVWAWRPRDEDISYMTLSGLGLGLATVSALTLHTTEMLFPPAPFFWLVFELIGIGNFMLVTFAVAAFLYFPQKLPYADVMARIVFSLVALYTLTVFFDGWDFSLRASEQLLYFEYAEVYFIEIVFYVVLLFCCLAQWFIARNKPLALVEALWILFATALTPMFFL